MHQKSIPAFASLKNRCSFKQPYSLCLFTEFAPDLHIEETMEDDIIRDHEPLNSTCKFIIHNIVIQIYVSLLYPKL